MSGGHFNYAQFRLEDIASQLDELIAGDDGGMGDGYGFTDATIEKFSATADALRQAQKMAHLIDLLVSFDVGEDTFHKRWAKEMKP